MDLVNNVMLIGRLGSDPKVTEMKNGNKVANFSISTIDSYKVKDEVKEITYWHNIVAWNKEAEKVATNCAKGTEVILTGKLVSRSYEDNKGEKRYISEVVVKEIICRTKAA